MARMEPTTKRRRHEWEELRLEMVSEPMFGYVVYDPGDVLGVAREVSYSARVAVVESEPGFERPGGFLRLNFPQPCLRCDCQMTESWWSTTLGDAVLEAEVGTERLKREKNPSKLSGVGKGELPSEAMTIVRLKMRPQWCYC